MIEPTSSYAVSAAVDAGFARDRTARRRHERIPYGKPFRAYVDGVSHEGTVEDISAGGARLEAPVRLDNATFVDLHVEGVGRVPASVVRSSGNGYCVAFRLAEPDAERLDATLAQFRSQTRDAI